MRGGESLERSDENEENISCCRQKLLLPCRNSSSRARSYPVQQHRIALLFSSASPVGGGSMCSHLPLGSIYRRSRCTEERGACGHCECVQSMPSIRPKSTGRFGSSLHNNHFKYLDGCKFENGAGPVSLHDSSPHDSLQCFWRGGGYKLTTYVDIYIFVDDR